jgi:prepilin-type N-terminal cleavage/methylation domain-containing protein
VKDRVRVHRDNRGFSLLELVIVLVLMGLVLALSYPSLSRGTVTLHLRGTGRDVLNCLRYAREKAITQQTAVLVTVDREAQTVVLTDDLGEGARSLSLPDDVRIQRVLLSGEEILDGPLVVRFRPNGSAPNAEIALQSKLGGVLRIVTDPITGGARILTAPGGSRP